MIISTLIALSLAAQPAFAAKKRVFVIPARVCINVGAIFEKADTCEKNSLYVQAAEACKRKIDAESKTTGLDVASLFSKKDQKAQQGKLAEAETDYEGTIIALSYMIGMTEKARVEIYNYMEHMTLPEDESDQEAAKEVSPVPCFRDNNNKLKAIAKELNTQQTRLEDAMDIAQANYKLSGKKKTELNGGVMSPEGDSPSGNGPSPKAPKGKNWSNSDISGTKKDKKK